MNLHTFFQVIGPFLEGQVDPLGAARVLYGDQAAASSPDARRLRIYGDFCRTHRHEALSVFSHCQAAVTRQKGEAAWEALVARYFQAHPMRHWELNENGAHFPAFLSQEGDLKMPFLAELADFEWWEWQTQIARDAPQDQDPEGGALRLSSTVELRRYGHDLIGWLNERDDGQELAGLPEPPKPKDQLVLFWRDPDGDLRREPASPEELLVLRLVSEGRPMADAAVLDLSADPEALDETLADLHAAGIILGLGLDFDLNLGGASPPAP